MQMREKEDSIRSFLISDFPIAAKEESRGRSERSSGAFSKKSSDYFTAQRRRKKRK